eukprot:scaffold20162_cov71-Phaeocystis_antarctica.AAC.2
MFAALLVLVHSTRALHPACALRPSRLYGTHSTPSPGRVLLPPRSLRCAPPAMKNINRREALQGGGNPVGDWLDVVRTDFKNSGFVDLAVPVAALGWALAQRGDTAAALAALELSSPGPLTGGAVQAPKVAVVAARAAGKVQVELVGPKLVGEYVDYLWLRDADSGALLGFKALKTNGGLPGSKADPSYSCLVEAGRRVVPFLHSSSSGLWRGEPFVARVST